MGEHVLIVGSGRSARDAAPALQASGYEAECVAHAPEALERLAANGYALVVLGSAPARARLTLCDAIRDRFAAMPILLLGAEPLERECLARPRGPDDYVVREFDADEICTRAHALVLRRGAMSSERPSCRAPLECGPLRLDPNARSVSHQGRCVSLTATEYQLLAHLAREPGRVFEREELLRSVWGYRHAGYSHTLTSHVNRLREKLERQLGAPRVVRTVRGLGYRYAPSPDA